MTTPLRLSAFAPPPVPSFVTPRAGTLPGSLTNSGESPGFSLDLARIQPVRETGQNPNVNFNNLVGSLAKNLQSSEAMRAHSSSLQVGSTVTETAGLTSSQKADLAFHLMLQIRNKLMDAYREIQQIQI